MNKNMRITLIIIALPFVFGLAKAQDHSSYYTESYRKKALEIYRTSIGCRTAKTHGLIWCRRTTPHIAGSRRSLPQANTSKADSDQISAPNSEMRGTQAERPLPGSLAAPQDSTIPMAAIEGKADVRETVSVGP